MVNNIKIELEFNELILEDYGDLTTQQWGQTRIITKTNIMLLARSRGKKVRGLKHRAKRPGLIIIDDPETPEDVRTKERRDKTYRWFFNEVIPARDRIGGARIFFIGNLLHTDSLLCKLQQKKNWLSKSIAMTHDGTESGISLWRAAFPDKASIVEEKENNDPITWQREYMLKIVPEDGQIIKEVHKYTRIPPEAVWQSAAVGVDFAISQKQTADYTAFVRGDIYEYKNKLLIYLTRAQHARLSMRGTIEMTKAIARNPDDSYATIYAEQVAYQQAAIEEMENEFLPVYGITTGTQDKRARLNVVSPTIQKGQVLFAESGMDDLIMQLVGFGVEAHDDLVDALTTMLRGIQKMGLQTDEIIWLN